jgi:hypothetical protein
MILPKQQLPMYATVIPSTKQRIKYRGFTVREEKQLLIAQESDDVDVIFSVIREIIAACVEGDVDVERLAVFDVEYLMTQIRAKSVGEVVTLNMPCEIDPTHKTALVPIDLTKIEVDFPPNHQTAIVLFDDVGVQMKYPTIGDIAKMENASGIERVRICIQSIFTDQEVFDAADQTPGELTEFIESLTQPQLQKIEDQFFKTMPTYIHEFEYKCPECGHVHKRLVRGISNFFT